ncbi:MAG TPA: hypothetical protein VHD56_13980 [Tepidisphaeraceae bacterium]|nr:hypothetical protein [Tepidisphaeraceae bacterium]
MLQRSKSVDVRHRAHKKRTVRTLLSVEQFELAIERESLRATRTSAGDLTLVLFRLSKPGKRRLSNMRLARTILKRIRATDDLGWFDRTHFGLLLPNTAANAAWRLAQDVCSSISRHGPAPLCTMYTYPAQQNASESADDRKLKMKAAS